MACENRKLKTMRWWKSNYIPIYRLSHETEAWQVHRKQMCIKTSSTRVRNYFFSSQGLFSYIRFFALWISTFVPKYLFLLLSWLCIQFWHNMVSLQPHGWKWRLHWLKRNLTTPLSSYIGNNFSSRIFCSHGCYVVIRILRIHRTKFDIFSCNKVYFYVFE